MTWKDLPRNPSRATLRQFAVLWLLFFGGLGAWKLHQGHEAWGISLVALAGLGGLPGILWPRLLRPIFVGWMMAVFPIGWLVSHTLLAAIYFVVLTPLALVFRLWGRDPLQLHKPQTASYWRLKPAPAGLEHYYRQF